jgi:hypothetical protein
VDSDIIIDFLLENCSSRKIYYVHNLTFEIFVFLRKMIEKKIKFKILSSDNSVYSAEIYYKSKRISLRCSYKLTMLSLKKLAELAKVSEKTAFPYKILDENIKEIMEINKEMFNNNEDFLRFSELNGTTIDTYKILKEYCKNDAEITKKSIIEF